MWYCKSQLDAEVERITLRLRERNTELPPRNVLRRQVLERLVVQEVQMQRANRLGMKVPDEMLNGTLEDVAQRNNITFSALPEALRAQGIDYQEFREEDTPRSNAAECVSAMYSVASTISPRELEQFLARQQKQPDQTSEIRCRTF